MRATITSEQCCALHLLDLTRVYPRHACARAALAMLELHRLRGVEIRKQDELKRQANLNNNAAAESQLAIARRRLVRMIGKRGGLRWDMKQRRLTAVSAA
jgi:hypothetical protein